MDFCKCHHSQIHIRTPFTIIVFSKPFSRSCCGLALKRRKNPVIAQAGLPGGRCSQLWNVPIIDSVMKAFFQPAWVRTVNSQKFDELARLGAGPWVSASVCRNILRLCRISSRAVLRQAMICGLGVHVLLDAGASIHGKPRMDEFAWSLQGENFHYGTPINPACPERIPGGSSSGSVVSLPSFSLGCSGVKQDCARG